MTSEKIEVDLSGDAGYLDASVQLNNETPFQVFSLGWTPEEVVLSDAATIASSVLAYFFHSNVQAIQSDELTEFMGRALANKNQVDLLVELVSKTVKSIADIVPGEYMVQLRSNKPVVQPPSWHTDFCVEQAVMEGYKCEEGRFAFSFLAAGKESTVFSDVPFAEREKVLIPIAVEKGEEIFNINEQTIMNYTTTTCSQGQGFKFLIGEENGAIHEMHEKSGDRIFVGMFKLDCSEQRATYLCSKGDSRAYEYYQIKDIGNESRSGVEAAAEASGEDQSEL